MPDAVTAEPVAVAEPTPLAEPIGERLDDAALDAILNKSLPQKKADPVVAAVEPEPVAEPAKPAPAPEPVKPAQVNPFDPPPSVLGEAPVKPEGATEDEYGTMPEEAPAQFKSKEAKAEYAKMRANHEKLKSDFKAFRETSKKAPKVDPNVEAQIADLTARNAELNSIVERKAIEEHPFVRQQFDEPRKQLFAIAKKALENADLPSDSLSKILSMDGKDRVDAMDELYDNIKSPSTREKVTNAIAQIDLLEEKKAEFFADRKGVNERMTQAQKAEQYRLMSEQEKQMTEMSKATVDWITNTAGFEFLKKATEPGSEKWNERVDNDLALIEELTLRNTNPQKLMTAVALGVTAPHYRAAWQSTLTRAKAAEARVAELEGTLPKMGGNGASEATTGATGDEMLDAAGVLPTDNLQTMARKLGAHMSTRQ